MSNTQKVIQQANNKMVDAIQENKQLKKRIAELDSENEALSEALDFEREYSKPKIAELEQAIMSNCYDDTSTSGKRLMALVENKPREITQELFDDYFNDGD